jgi:hypothetical protein
MRIKPDATSWMTQWYLKDFAKPERIARSPIERARKEEERMKPWRETKPKGLWAWTLGSSSFAAGIDTLASDTWAMGRSPDDM